MSSDTTKEQLSPEVWEAQQQELVRLARRVAELEGENTSLRAEIADNMAMHESEESNIHAMALGFQERAAQLEWALKEIVDPIVFMRARADAEGHSLNGIVCVQMSESHSYLREIAKRALAAQPESPHNAPSLPQEPPVPVSAGDSSSEYAGMPWEGRP